MYLYHFQICVDLPYCCEKHLIKSSQNFFMSQSEETVYILWEYLWKFILFSNIRKVKYQATSK